MCMQLELAGKGTVLGLQDTWKAVVGGKLGHRALLVGVLPRVCSSPNRAQHTPAKGRWLAQRLLFCGYFCALSDAGDTQQLAYSGPTPNMAVQALKRTLQTALVWTLY